MKIVKLLSAILLVGSSVFSPSALLAHVGLTEAMPGDGAVVHEGPEYVTLRFTEEVRLLGLTMSGMASHAVEINFEPSGNMGNEFSITMPALTADSYTVEWVVMGSDSHRVEGEFTFTVDLMAAEMMGENHDMPEHYDAH